MRAARRRSDRRRRRTPTRLLCCLVSHGRAQAVPVVQRQQRHEYQRDDREVMRKVEAGRFEQGAGLGAGLLPAVEVAPRGGPRRSKSQCGADGDADDSVGQAERHESAPGSAVPRSSAPRRNTHSSRATSNGMPTISKPMKNSGMTTGAIPRSRSLTPTTGLPSPPIADHQPNERTGSWINSPAVATIRATIGIARRKCRQRRPCTTPSVLRCAPTDVERLRTTGRRPPPARPP